MESPRVPSVYDGDKTRAPFAGQRGTGGHADDAEDRAIGLDLTARDPAVKRSGAFAITTLPRTDARPVLLASMVPRM